MSLKHSGDSDGIDLQAYDPRWPGMFAAMERQLQEQFGREVVSTTVHIGSTAIPGTAAKPVIDMLVAVPSFDVARRCVLPVLRAEGWGYFWRDDRPPGHMMFIRYCSPEGPRTHHVHVAPAGHTLWERVAFRDYLVQHPEEAARYLALKRTLADRFPRDREAYTNGKGDYVRRITQIALEWQGTIAR